MLRGSVFFFLIYMILRDLSDPCFGLQSNTDYTSTDLAVGQEVRAFSPPKFSLKKSYLRNKHHFGFSGDASVRFVNLTRDVLLVTLLLQYIDVSLNPAPYFIRSRGLKIAHLNVRSLMPKLDSLKGIRSSRHQRVSPPTNSPPRKSSRGELPVRTIVK